MTVSNENAKDIYPISAATTSFSYSYTFDIVEAEDINIDLYDEDGDVVETLTYVSDTPDSINEFSVDTAAKTVTIYDDGEATFQDAYGTYVESIVIYRVLGVTQEVELVTNRALQASTVEAIVDKLTILIQDMDEVLDRVIRFPKNETSPPVTLPSVEARASGYMAFDDDGNIKVTSDILTVPDAITVSAFMETVLDDTTAAAARTTLGLGDVATLDIDTDGTMAANSDSKIPTQQAVVEYVGAKASPVYNYVSIINGSITDETNPDSLWVAGVWSTIDIGPDGLDIVPAGTKAVNIRGLITDNVATTDIRVGKGGTSSPDFRLDVLVADASHYNSGIVGTQISGNEVNLDVFISGGAINHFNLNVIGYWG